MTSLTEQPGPDLRLSFDHQHSMDLGKSTAHVKIKG